jgi:hypothetical protein
MERVGRTELPDKPLWLRERASLPDKERGDLGIVLRVRGVDYESLDQAAQEYAVKRLEAALKTFGVGFHVYQYLFKTNRPDIPFQKYEDPAIQAAVDQRKEFFRQKLDRLFDVEIFYAIVIEGTRSKTGVMAALSRLPHDPNGGLQELKTQLSNDKLRVLLREQIEADLLQAGTARSQLHPPAFRLRANRRSVAERLLPVPATFTKLRRLEDQGPSQGYAIPRLPDCKL